MALAGRGEWYPKLHRSRNFIGHGESEVGRSTGTETGRSLKTKQPGFLELWKLDMAIGQE